MYHASDFGYSIDGQLPESKPRRSRLVWLAGQCRMVIDRAKADGLAIDAGNVVDLCADNISASLSEIDAALRELGSSYWEM